MDPVEEIKSKIDLVDFISEYLELKQTGMNFRASCPFHSEKTPSFFVSPERQIWHCFGCQKTGDIFSFIQEIEGIDFPEALRILAQRAGVKLEKFERQAVSQKTKILDICYWSAEFYHKVLLESSLAEVARKYLKERGLNKKIIADFKIGFAPDKWDTLFKFLIKRGFKEADIEAAGLISKSSKGGFYDRFRNRIIFPIADSHDQIVGFTSRILPSAEDEKTAKYINTPETLVYNKGRILYGLNKAKLVAKKENQIILTEGNMDVIACHQFGFENTVCTSGTALTQEQIKLLQRFTQNIILAFDVDLAGQTATGRSIDMLLQQGLEVKILKLEQGKDPDEFIRNDLKGWKKSLENPQPIMEYYFSLALQDKDLKKIGDKKEISRLILPIINKLGDPVEKDLWLKKLSADLNVSEISLREALKGIKQPNYNYGKTVSENKIEKISREQRVGEIFAALLLIYPDQRESFLKNVVLDMFPETKIQEAIKIIKDCHQENKKIDSQEVKEKIKEKDLDNYFRYLYLLGENDFKDFSPLELEKELDCLFLYLKEKYLNRRLRILTQELKEEEKKEDQEAIKKISLKIIKISREIATCK